MKYRKRGSAVVAFDTVVNFIWRACRILGRMLAAVCCATADFVARIWSATYRLPHGSRACREIGGFFRGAGRGFRIVFYPFVAAANRIAASADRSQTVRRLVVCLLVSGLVVLYWLFTPGWPYGAWHACENGKASWYGGEFYFRRTASGEWFLPGPFYTAAHKTLPLGTRVLVVNSENRKRVVVRINDRGPFVEGRIIDLTYAAAKRIDAYQPGTADVTIYTRKPRYKHARRIFVVPFRPSAR